MVGSDRGEAAYHRENKTTTTTSLSSSSSLVSLRRVLATSLTATRPYLSVESLVPLGPWVRVALSSGRWLRCHWWALVVQRCWRDSLVLGSRCRSLGAGRRLPLRILGRGSGRRRAHVLSSTLVTWACVWLSCFVVRRLSWCVGGQGCSWWWVLRVRNVVARRC